MSLGARRTFRFRNHFFATCPHCFQRINLFRGVFRCAGEPCVPREDALVKIDGKEVKVSSGDAIRPKPDQKLSQVWEDNTPYAHTFEIAGLSPPLPYFGSIKRKARCPASNEITIDRICPNCHKSLYSRFGESSERRLTLIGATNAGKSNYIAVVIQELGEKVGGRMGFALQRMNQTTSDIYEANYFEPVYRRHEQVGGTDQVRSRRDAIAPMVFGLITISNDKLSTISLFDPPGEGVINERNVSRFHHFVFNSHGLVLLVDGEKLAASQNSGLDQAMQVLQTAILQLEADRSWGKRLRPFLAITVSKGDLLRDSGALPEHVTRMPNYDHGFDESDFSLVSSEVEAMLRRRGGVNFCNLAKASFGGDHVGFFVVSSFGCKPDPKTGLIPRLEPLRVADPFLWLMNRTGIIATEGARP